MAEKPRGGGGRRARVRLADVDPLRPDPAGAQPKRRSVPRMADVARLAGVSDQTVSRVLNNQRYVGAATRARVLSAIEDLGYRPNSAAQALSSGRSRTLGVVTFDTTLYGAAANLFSIEQSAREAGYFVTVVSVPSLTPDSAHEAVERLRHQGVEGIIVIGPRISAAQVLTDLAVDLPLVLAVGPSEAGVVTVEAEQAAGAASVTQYLLDLGHETVWHIAGEADWLSARERMAGWRSTLEAAGAAVPEPLRGDWTPQSGYEIARRLAVSDQVTAVFACNDDMALGVMSGLEEGGRKVPDDVSVVGYDDIPHSRYFSPALTTVRLDFIEVGKRSLELLLRQIEPEAAEPTSAVVPAQLMVRESAAPPRGRRRPRATKRQ